MLEEADGDLDPAEAPRGGERLAGGRPLRRPVAEGGLGWPREAAVAICRSCLRWTRWT